MAVDTREKRFSMLNFGDGNHLYATFEADGAVDLDDRQHLLDCYSGIAFAAPTAVVEAITLTLELSETVTSTVQLSEKTEDTLELSDKVSLELQE